MCLPLQLVPHDWRDVTATTTATIATTATDTMTATSTMTVPTVTVTATIQSCAWWGCRQQHLHGVRWGHGGFPGQTPTWIPLEGAGMAGRRREPSLGMVLCKSWRLPGASVSHGAEAAVDGAAGGSPQGLKNWSCSISLGSWSLRGAGGARWGSRWSLPQAGALLGAHSTSRPPAHHGEPALGSLPRV